MTLPLDTKSYLTIICSLIICIILIVLRRKFIQLINHIEAMSKEFEAEMSYNKTLEDLLRKKDKEIAELKDE